MRPQWPPLVIPKDQLVPCAFQGGPDVSLSPGIFPLFWKMFFPTPTHGQGFPFYQRGFPPPVFPPLRRQFLLVHFYKGDFAGGPFSLDSSSPPLDPKLRMDVFSHNSSGLSPQVFYLFSEFTTFHKFSGKGRCLAHFVGPKTRSFPLTRVEFTFRPRFFLGWVSPSPFIMSQEGRNFPFSGGVVIIADFPPTLRPLPSLYAMDPFFWRHCPPFFILQVPRFLQTRDFTLFPDGIFKYF